MKSSQTFRIMLATVAATGVAAISATSASAALKAPNGAPCTITGTAGHDFIRGTPGDDVICGLGGNDAINGFGGDDVIVGGAGDDLLHGGGGRDLLHGGPGDDRFPRDARDRIADRRAGDLVGDYGVSVKVGVVDFTGQTLTTSQGTLSNCTRDESYGPTTIGADNALVLSMTVKNTWGCVSQPSYNSWRIALPGGGGGQVDVRRPQLGKDYAPTCLGPWTGATCTQNGTRVTITKG